MSLSQDLLAFTPRLRAYAWAITRGQGDADDLVQETLLRAWQFRHTYQDGTNLKAWLFRILRNVHLAALRGATKVTQELDDGTAAELSQGPDQEWRVRFNDVMAQLERLPVQNREALLLVAGSGLSYEEAAEVCGVSIGTIKSRVCRAREALAGLETQAEAPLEPRHQPARPTPRPGWGRPVAGRRAHAAAAPTILVG